MRDGLKISEELIAAIPQRTLRGNGVVQLLTDDYEFLLAAATISVETARKRRACEPEPQAPYDAGPGAIAGNICYVAFGDLSRGRVR